MPLTIQKFNSLDHQRIAVDWLHVAVFQLRLVLIVCWVWPGLARSLLDECGLREDAVAAPDVDLYLN